MGFEDAVKNLDDSVKKLTQSVGEKGLSGAVTRLKESLNPSVVFVTLKLPAPAPASAPDLADFWTQLPSVPIAVTLINGETIARPIAKMLGGLKDRVSGSRIFGALKNRFPGSRSSNGSSVDPGARGGNSARGPAGRVGSTGSIEDLERSIKAEFAALRKFIEDNSRRLGEDIGRGVVEGVKGEGRGVVAALRNMVKRGIRGARDEAETSSPSRVTIRLGRDIAQGLVQGLKGGQAKVASQARRLAKAGTSAQGVKGQATRTGRQIGDGLAGGIRQSRGKVAAAMRSATQPVASSAKAASAGLKPLNAELASTSKAATKSGRQMGTATKGLKGIGPAGKIAGKGLKGVGAGFKSALGPAGLILMLLTPFIEKLIETVTRSKKFKKAVEVAMKGVSKAIGWISKVVKQVFNWVKKNWKKLLPLLLGPFGAVIAGVLIFRKQITAGIKWVINWVKKNWKLLLAILTGPFGLAIVFVIKFRKRIGSAIGAAIGWIKGNWQRLLGILVRPFTAGASAVARVFSRIVSYARGLPGRIRGAIGSVGSVLAGKGRDLISGFINGIRSRAGAIISTIKNFVTDKIPGFVKNALGIRSPSTVMAGLGRNVSEGMAQGIEDGGRNVTDAMDALVAVPRIGSAGAGAYPPSLGRRGEASQRRYEFHFHGPVTDPEETSRQFASRLREWEVLNAAS